MQNCLWKLKLCGRYTLSEMELLPNTPNFTGRADIISELKKRRGWYMPLVLKFLMHSM
jgi:hypothetical protein